MPVLPLAGVRVLDLTDGIAGAYCTKLLADAGADAVVAEPPGGQPGRRHSPDLFDYLHTTKRSVSRDRAGLLRPGADIVVVDESFDVDAARRECPQQVVVAISPWGRRGPWARRPATEFTMQAACGSTGGRGLPGLPPLAAGGRIGEWLAGTYAAVGALAAWMEAHRSGRGEEVDVAMFDCMAVGMVTFPSVFAAFAAARGRPGGVATVRRVEVPSIEPTRDGYVNFTTNSAQQFRDFALLIGHPEVADDDAYQRAAARFANRDRFWSMTRAYTTSRTSSEVIEEATRLRIPVAPVLDGKGTLGFEQFASRQVFTAHPSGRFRQPRIPYRMDGGGGRPFAPVPDPGQHDRAVDWPATPPPRQPEGWRLPLAGVRVVDLTAWWAGPCAVHVLGCLGADVVKVESTQRPDLMRFASACGPDEPDWWEWSALVHAVNTNKRGVTIDLSHPEGRRLASRLFETADLVVENYTPRVMDNFGFDWPRLHELNRRLCLVRMPAFGLDGPWRDRPGFAQTMEAVTGLASLTGFPDGPPTLVGGAGDPVAGLHAAFACLLALCARAGDGEGHLVESTMVEAVLNVAAEGPIAAQTTGRAPARCGNGSPVPVIAQGVYPCAGEDEWIALTLEDPGQLAHLPAALGVPAPAGGHPDDLDRWLTELASRCRADELAERLAASGVAAAAVIAPWRVADNLQLASRGLFETEHHPVTGDQRVPGLPLRMSRVDAWVRSPSPRLGEHNEEVFEELGVGAGRREQLRRDGVIGEGLASR